MAEEKLLNIYSASAGSGKTYTLVKEYLRILLSSSDEFKFRRILAMTFTNKAANEMKGRVLQALVDLSTAEVEQSEKQKKYLAEISKEFSIKKELLQNRSAGILNNILHNYGHFSVLTIDKFTHKVIRTFARDLNLSFDFDVELDLDTLRKEVTDLVFDQVGRDPGLTKLMLEYVSRQMSDDKSWNFSHQLMEFSKQLFKENAIKAISKLSDLEADDFIRVQKELLKEKAVYENTLKSLAQKGDDLIKLNGLEPADFVSKSGSVANYFEKIADGSWNRVPSNKVISNMAEGKYGHKDSPNKDVADSIGPELGSLFDDLINFIEKNGPDYILQSEILKNFNNLSLLKYYLEIIETVKEEENKLLISDFYKKIAEIITKEPVPFIYERLGVRYEHFLLDEFQDTSQLQWTNLVPLLHNSLASGHRNLIVGDAKQAIYRWRNGEVDQFIQLPERVHNPENIDSLSEAEPIFKALGDKHNLESNWRSAPEIVNFNNDFFAYLKDKLTTYEHIYQDAAQKVQKEGSGFVRAYVEDNLSDEDQMNFVLDSIDQALDKGYSLSDIAVLCRKKDKGAAVGRFLSEKGHQVISVDSLFIGNSLAVKMMVNLLMSLDNLHNHNFRVKTMEHYARLSLEEDADQFVADKKDFIRENNIIYCFKEVGIDLPFRNKFHNLYDYVEALCSTFELKAHADLYVQSFLDQVHLFEKRNNSSIRDFIEWYEESGYQVSVKIPENTDAAQIMTIHKAKGLEFPVVICPFLDWDITKRREVSWITDEREDLPAYLVKITSSLEKTRHNELYKTEVGKEELDHINLLYVALTRAENALFLSCKAKSSLGKNWIKPYFENSSLFSQSVNYLDYGLFEENQNAEQEFNEFRASFTEGEFHKPTLSFRRAHGYEIDSLDEKRVYGNKIHLILSQMRGIADLPKVLESLLIKGVIEKSELTDLEKDIQALFEEKEFADYFIQDAKNELRLIDGSGRSQIPDKVLFKSTGVIVVDFKTGQRSPDHFEQVDGYVKLLTEMGYDNVRGELYYIAEKEKVVV